MHTEHVHIDTKTPSAYKALVGVAIAINSFNRVSILSRHQVAP